MSAASFLSRGRTFAVLNARSPALPKEKEAKVERRRPDWMPPVKVFPVIWITIGILRAVSTTMVSGDALDACYLEFAPTKTCLPRQAAG